MKNWGELCEEVYVFLIYVEMGNVSAGGEYINKFDFGWFFLIQLAAYL